jgi:bacterioferritin
MISKQEEKAGVDIRQDTGLSDDQREQVITLLQQSYNMELETISNYLANSIHLDGMLAMEVKESLEEDVNEELNHARQLARRIKVLGGYIPGSQDLSMNQTTLQPPQSTVDVLSVVKGVIDAEDAAIDQYQKLIQATGDDKDPVTQDLAVTLKGEEEEHRREFAGFLREYEALKEMYT